MFYTKSYQERLLKLSLHFSEYSDEALQIFDPRVVETETMSLKSDSHCCVAYYLF